jgi:hypothetical protein
MRESIKFSLLIALLILFPVAGRSQIKATAEDGKKVILNADGTWKYADPAAAPSNVTLKIEAGIVYSYGGTEPVARTTFGLLDVDPTPEIKKAPPSKMAGEFRLNVNNGWEEMLFRCGSSMPEAMAIIESHLRYRMTTGFDGKGEFAGVKPGKYWVFGATRMREGCAFWLLDVDLTKSGSLTLDQNNAFIGKPTREWPLR